MATALILNETQGPGPYLVCRSCQGVPESFQRGASPGAVENDDWCTVSGCCASAWLVLQVKFVYFWSLLRCPVQSKGKSTKTEEDEVVASS